jgi:pyruvate dehydrogenase (quinone)
MHRRILAVPCRSRFAILQAVVDQLEPPLPAKITEDQALHFAESLARGEPNRSKIALTAVSEKVRELI